MTPVHARLTDSLGNTLRWEVFLLRIRAYFLVLLGIAMFLSVFTANGTG